MAEDESRLIFAALRELARTGHKYRSANYVSDDLQIRAAREFDAALTNADGIIERLAKRMVDRPDG